MVALGQPKSGKPTKPMSTEGPEIEWARKEHNFGRVDINLQYIRTKFMFKNTGNKPLVITNAVASCGCTTPNWTKDSVLPGDSGFVEVKYETIGRPGGFRKAVTVYSNSINNAYVQLDILGDVYVEPVKAEEKAPDYGKLYFSKQTLEFKTLRDNGTDTVQVRVVNGSLFTTEFEPLLPLPVFCKITGYPTTLEPNENALMTIILDGRLIKSYGFGAFEIPINSSSPVNPNMGLYVAYTRRQYFPKMNEKQLAKTARLKLSTPNELLDFGKHASGDVLDTMITFTNTGKSDLVIHEIYPECTCVRVTFNKNILKPGESMPVSFSYDTVTKNGTTTHSVWIVSNDPTKPERFLYLKTTLPKREQKCQTCPDR